MRTRLTTLALAGIAAAMLGSGTAVADRLITSADIKNDSITAADVKNATLTGTDVKNGSIKRIDLDAAIAESLDGSGVASTGPRGATGSTGAAGPQGPRGEPGQVASGVLATAGSATADTTTSTSWMDLAEMSVNVDAPAGTTRLVISYTAECGVTHADEPRSAAVRIVVDGVEALPRSGMNLAFCSAGTPPTVLRPGAAAIQRVANVGAGRHSVKVQFAVSGNSATARLDDDLLVVSAG